MMIRVLFVIYIYVFSFAALCSEVAIVNSSFEDPVTDDGSFQDPNIPGWTKEKPTSVYRIFNPADSYEIQPVDGDNFLWLAPAGPSAILSQTTGYMIESQSVYEFSINIGCISSHFGYDLSSAFYTVVLYASDGSNIELIYSSGAQPLQSPSWSQLKVRFNSAEYSSMVGKYFKILLAGKMVMFDDVRITYGGLKQLTIETSPSEAGIDTVMPVVGDYACYEGEIVDLEAYSFVVCPDVYNFTGWSGDVADATASMTTVTMDADKTIAANFVIDSGRCQQLGAVVDLDNTSFEMPAVADGGYQILADLPGWNIDANDITYTLYNSDSSFQAPDGENHLAMQLAGVGSGQISQIASNEIEADTVYYFTFDVAAYDTSGYYLFSLYYTPKTSGHLLETTGVGYLNAAFEWNTVTVAWDSSAHPELVGEKFEIVLAGKKMFFDNFQAYEQPGISINNPSFERPVIPEDGYQFITDLPGWNMDANDVTYTGYNSDSSFGATDGDNHIAFQLAGPGSGSISQIPAGAIQADTLYTFNFDVAAYDVSGYYLFTLYYSPKSPSHQLATTGVSYLSQTFQWQTVSLQWDSSDHPELVGKNFEIALAGKKMYFDNLSVDPAGDWSAMMDLQISTSPPGLESYVSPAAGEYAYGEAVSVTAASEAITCPQRYVFDGWTENGVALSGDTVPVWVMNSDKHLVANYSEDTGYQPSCSSVCRPLISEDLDKNCVVDLYDFIVLSNFWLDEE
jgi:hypothetical protein